MAQTLRVAALVAAVHSALAARMRLDQLQGSAGADGGSEALNVAAHLPLCAEEIVAETCQDAFGKEGPDGTVTADDLQEMLSATPKAAAALWAELAFEPAAAASCRALCGGVAEALKRGRAAPPASDVACYVGGRGRGVRCDVDVRPESLKRDTTFKGDLPDFHDNEKKQLLSRRGNATAAALVERPRYSAGIDYRVKEALRRTANLFRIYPATLTTVEEEAGDEDVEVAEGAEGALLEAGRGSSDWKTKIQQVSVKAIAYVQTALRKFKARNTKDAITKWYGKNAYTDTTLRKRLLTILNGVDAMLGNVEFVMGPKKHCSDDTYAYVYPEADECTASEVKKEACTKNSKGQFIFYICPLTLKSSLSVQIETLTHEGSHHATAFTDDVDFRGETAYGRETCEDLARYSSRKAGENADNFCYYVQDVTDGV